MNKITSEFIRFCKKQIAQAKTNEILTILLNLDIDYENEVILISNRWNELTSQRISGSISEENYKLASNNINQSLLLLLDELSKGIKQINFDWSRFISINHEQSKDINRLVNSFKIDSLVLLNMFGSNWAVNECMVGLEVNNQIIDYITITGQSGMHDLNLIKVGHPELNLLNADNSINIRLREYIKEVNGWKVWIRENHKEFTELLSERMISTYGGESIRSSQNRHKVSCNIFYGTRESFSEEENRFRVSLFEEEDIQIIPYNRIGEIKQKKRGEWRNTW